MLLHTIHLFITLNNLLPIEDGNSTRLADTPYLRGIMTRETIQEPAIEGDIQVPKIIPTEGNAARLFLGTRATLDTVIAGTRNGYRRATVSVRDHAIFLIVLSFIILWTFILGVEGEGSMITSPS